MTRVLSGAPGLLASARIAPADALTDLAATHLYLTGQLGPLDEAVRGARVGPHTPLARCVASGLALLPSFRGATAARAMLSDAERQWYAARELVTEWAFCRTLTSLDRPLNPPRGATGTRLPGNVDVLIWSLTGRRTSLLDPGLPDQVIFLPGTSFKVLRADHDRPGILLRELSPSEIGVEGQVELGRVPLDDLALRGLEQAAEGWREAREARGAGADTPAVPPGMFTSPPGLITEVGPPPCFRSGENAVPAPEVST